MKIYKANTIWKDSFPELLSMWEESGYCEIVKSDERCSWANEVGDVLLFEHDRADHLPKSWNVALFANQIHVGKNTSPWIYWGRHPRNIEKVIDEGILNYSERDIESIFLGKVENAIQYENRTRYDWSSAVQVFSMPIELGISGQHRLPNMDYLRMIKRAKFGLCLPGHGPKCQREIELLSLGVVPIITPGVDTNYYEKLEKGVHYLYAENPQQAVEVARECRKERWRGMSVAGLDWYERNCSRRHSFNRTVDIINELKNKQ